MKIISPDNLSCPLDSALLSYENDKCLVCENGHSFDVARQGYVNLLPVQDKRSKSPGDTKDMVKARQEFLNLGYYNDIAAYTAQIVRDALSENQKNMILDAGCGEGYYLDYILQELQQDARNGQCGLIGYDISKWAVIEACKRNKADITWLVATNRRPPIAANSLTQIISMFGFPVFDMFAQLLKADGQVLLVEAGNNHLLEIKQHIYSEIKPHAHTSKIEAAQQAGFAVGEKHNLSYTATLKHLDDFYHLLKMTPYFYKMDDADKEALSKSCNNITIDVDFIIFHKA
ncbi:MAG: putative RNA methyltransferase [Alphaproteobacteria bacterium]